MAPGRVVEVKVQIARGNQGKRMRTSFVHGRMATDSVWKEEEIKDSLPCKEFSEFKVSFLKCILLV